MASIEVIRLFVKILEDEDPGWYSRAVNYISVPVIDVEMNHDPKADLSIKNEMSLPETKSIPTGNGNSVETHDKDIMVEGFGSVSVYDQWVAPNVSGTRPKPRYEHAAAVVDDKMYIPWEGNKLISIIGHSKDPFEVVNVKAFDLQTNTWSTMKTYGKPHSLGTYLIWVLRRAAGATYTILENAETPTLKLIDLPGVDKGNLDDSLSEYAQHNDAVLLVIILAAQVPKIASAKSLRIAKEYAGESTRTIGVNMADLMIELGYNSTSDVSLCKDLLSSFSPLNEITVAMILGTIVRSDSSLQDQENAFSTFGSALGRGSLPDMSSLSSWNTEVLIESIKQLAPGINWTTVIKNLDHKGFYIPGEATISLLISCYRLASQDLFPLSVVCGNVWKNTEVQLSFLKYVVSVPPEVFTFAHCEKQVAYVDAVNTPKFQFGYANHAWLCLDLLEVLCQLAEIGLAKSVRLLLEYALKHCPEVLLYGMAHVNEEEG
ncbi:hypothetical protein Lser_V15G40951 [Lactuca serriola]